MNRDKLAAIPDGHKVRIDSIGCVAEPFWQMPLGKKFFYGFMHGVGVLDVALFIFNWYEKGLSSLDYIQAGSLGLIGIAYLLYVSGLLKFERGIAFDEGTLYFSWSRFERKTISLDQIREVRGVKQDMVSGGHIELILENGWQQLLNIRSSLFAGDRQKFQDFAAALSKAVQEKKAAEKGKLQNISEKV